MAELTANKLVDLIKRSQLVDDERLELVLDKERRRNDGALPEDHKALAQQLIKNGLLTEWQAEKLLAGKHKGFRLGKYKLLGQIGKGGMSSVYLAEHTMMRRQVAIKVLPRGRVRDASYLERFQLEARAVARLDDPNIVRAYDIDNEGDTHYIVMEYVDGRDLHQLVSDRGPIDYDTAADYIAQAANGLQHAHEMGLVHRDIKPANCLLDKHNTVKLLDMGLAKLANDDETSLTLANDENVLGTADYLAPEQALNSHEADARSDIYSLGCTLYFLLVGRPPFPEGTISERLLKHQVEEPEGILKFRPDAPLSLLEICQRMMCKKAEDRYQTAGEVAEKLTDWLASRGRKLGGGHIRSGDDEDSGIGSGILSRFSVAPPVGTPLPTPASSETLPSASAADRDTTKLAGPDTTPDEDIGLAPLDDDEGKSPESKAKLSGAKLSGTKLSASAKSGGLKTGRTKSGRIQSPGSKLGAAGSGSSAKQQDSSAGKKADSKASSSDVLSTGSGDKIVEKPKPKPQPKKSIFDEEFSTDDDPIKNRAKKKATSAFDPLHPPGYVSPFNRNRTWLWTLLAVGGLAAMGLLIQILMY